MIALILHLALIAVSILYSVFRARRAEWGEIFAVMLLLFFGWLLINGFTH